MAVDPTPFYRDVATVRPRFGLIAFKDIRPTADPPYLIKGLVPREGLTVEWGAPKSGKSFQAFDMAMSVALGRDYRARRVQQGPVVYIAAEGATGLRGRVEAYRRHHGIDHQEPVPFYIVPDALDLTTDAAALIASIRQTLGESRPALVVLDTLNRSLAGSENDPADMGAYIRAADSIRETFTCAVLVVHHCGTEGSRPRGHTSLTGAADAQLAVKRTADSTITTTVEWMKDGPEGDMLYSRLEVVNVGQDHDGDEITSCVILEADPPTSPDQGRKMTPNQQTMLTILQEAGPAGLSVEEWNEQAREIGLYPKQKQRLYDLRQVLKHKRLVHTCGDRWFVTTQ